MEFCVFGFKSYFVIVFISALRFVACSNIDCNGKAFHCVNSTHFKICVDLGGGISTTVDDFLIPCPQDTVCKSYNLFECEYEQTTTSPTVTILSEVTNEQFQTSDVSRLNLTTRIPLDHNQGGALSQNNNTLGNTYASSSTTLPTNEVFNTVTVDSVNFTQSSAQELSVTETTSFSPVTTTETSLYNIIQSDLVNNAGNYYNTENPSFYSTVKNSVTNDYLINEKFTLPSSDLSESLKNNENISHVSYIPKSTESGRVQTVIGKQDTIQILYKNLPKNISEVNILDTKITHDSSYLNNSNFKKNDNNSESSTVYPLPNISSVNGNSDTNLLFMTTTTLNTYQTDGTIKINLYEPKTDKIPEYLLENRTLSNPIEKTTDQFVSTIYVNTDISDGAFKNSDPDLKNMNNLFNLTDGYSIMAISINESTTTANANEITSQINTNLDNGVYSDKNADLFLDTENSTLINKEQTSKNEMVSLNNASNCTTLLDNLNNTNYVFSTERCLLDEKLVSSTEAMALITEVDEIQHSALSELVNFDATKETTSNPISRHSKIKNETSIHHGNMHLITETFTYTTEKSILNTSVDILFKNITKHEPQISSTLTLNNTVFTTAIIESAITETERTFSSDITVLPVSTEKNVTNDIQRITLISPDILVKTVTTELAPLNEMSDQRYISTEKPLMLYSTIVDGNKEHALDLNILDFLVTRNTVEKDMNFTSPLVTTEATTFPISNTEPNKVTIDPLSATTTKLLPISDVSDRIPGGQKSKEGEPMIIEKGDKNGRQVGLVNVIRTKVPENLTTEIKYDNSSTDIFAPPEKQLRTIPTNNEDKGFKSITQFFLTTPTVDPVSIGIGAFTTQKVVEKHLTESNTVLPTVTEINEYSFNSTQTDFYHSMEPRVNSIINSEKNNMSNNTSYPTTLENPMILTNATRLDTPTELIWISLYNETEMTNPEDNSLNETHEAILKNRTEVNNVLNISDISYTETSVINEFNTIETDFLATDQLKDGVTDIYTDKILEQNANTLKYSSSDKSTTSTGISRNSDPFKSRGIDLDMVKASRMSHSNTSTNTTAYELNSTVTIEPSSYTYSYITTSRNILTPLFLDKETVRDENLNKPKTESILLRKIGMSNNSEQFDKFDKNNNTKNIYDPETLNIVENLYSVGGNSQYFNRTDKTLVTSDGTPLIGVSQSSFEPHLTDVNNFSLLEIQENITLASPVDDYGMKNNYNGNEYKKFGYTNENLQVQTDVINYIQYVNKTETSKLTVNLTTTMSVKESDSHNTLLKPSTRESNRSHDFGKKFKTSPSLERNTLNDNKNNIMTNKSTSYGVIESNNQTAQANMVFQTNSSENVLTPLMIIQAPSLEKNKTTNIVSNNISDHEFAFKNKWNQDIYSRNLNKTGDLDTDAFVLSLSSKTNLNRSVTNELPTLFVELSEKIFIASETNKTIKSTSNYANNESLLPDSIRVRSEARIKSKSNETEEKGKSPTFIHNHYETNTLVSTNNYYDTITKTTINEVMKGNTNIIPTTTAKAMHAHTRYNDKPSKQEFVCAKRGKYSDHFNCNKFYICFGRTNPIIGICPPNTVFSELLKQCTKNVAHCIRNDQFKCSTIGRFINILSNNTYFICAKRKTGFLRFTLQCQKGYFLNKRNIKCTPELFNISTSDESSNNTKEVSVEKSREGEINKKKYFECTREGKYEDTENCRRYYVCKKGKHSTFRRKLKKCDSDEVFHKKKKKCVDEESYECNI